MDFGPSAFGGNDDPSWLGGESFDLNDLLFSIPGAFSLWDHARVHAHSTRSHTNEPSDETHDSDESGRSDTRNIVQARWYVRPAVEATSPYATARLENQDKVDEAYRAGLSHHLQPCLHDDALPSADFLVCFRKI